MTWELFMHPCLEVVQVYLGYSTIVSQKLKKSFEIALSLRCDYVHFLDKCPCYDRR